MTRDQIAAAVDDMFEKRPDLEAWVADRWDSTREELVDSLTDVLSSYGIYDATTPVEGVLAS